MATQPHPTPPRRVLLIDDNVDLTSMLSLCLQADGVDVMVAADGEAGLALLKERPVDVVVTDLFMPDKDGIETIVELKKRYPDVKIVVMSGFTSIGGTDYLGVARELGAVTTLKKPFDPAELSKVVRELTA
jgi:DNA-binding response OmpR family regulator